MTSKNAAKYNTNEVIREIIDERTFVNITIKSRYNRIARKLESRSGRVIVNKSQHPRGVIRRRSACDRILNYFAYAAGINNTKRDHRENVVTPTFDRRSSTAVRRKIPLSRAATIASVTFGR